jgi:uncharacterized protein YabN with tetrapyrrole methylase and pyrophosphatase domain
MAHVRREPRKVQEQEEEHSMAAGSLIVVGTGIRIVGQLTAEAIAWIQKADKVLYGVGDPVAEASIRALNPSGAESLTDLYKEGKPRRKTYEQMVERVLACVRAGLLTCMACYGHPGVFVYPSHEAIRRARREGYAAKMLPGISAEDCLFADLGIDPATTGCQSYEATDFFVNQRRIDPRSTVILWQIGVVGDMTYKRFGYDLSAMPLLLAHLLKFYPAEHVAYIYDAAMFLNCEHAVTPVPLYALGQAGLTSGSTLYIPPAFPTYPNPALRSFA